MFYTNRSSITKTFHGVTFRPGDTKEVFGIINDSAFIHSSTRQEPPKCDRSVSSKSKESSSEKSVVLKRGRKKATSTPVSSQEEVQNEDLDNLDNTDNKEV